MDRKTMMDPNFNIRKYLTWSFVLILFLLISGLAIAGDLMYPKVKNIEPHEVNGQYCYIKIEIVTDGDTVTKEEKLVCADGRQGIETPGYWDLFAQFYYRDVQTPEYCRYYSRDKHAFKSPGKVCLQSNGEWEVK
tara:strand:+ start:38 stop:442 length:405 start_codon:yes stop_codon:yes gene_type:complete